MNLDKNFMKKLRPIVGLKRWDFCILWKLSEDRRFLKWVDCCCCGSENGQNDEHVHHLCRDIIFPHPRIKSCVLLDQLPFSISNDSRIYEQTMMSKQPKWLNFSRSSDSNVFEIGTRVLIPVPEGLIELFSAKQVPEDRKLIEFISSQCDISRAKNEAGLLNITNALTTMSLQGNDDDNKDSMKHQKGKSGSSNSDEIRKNGIDAERKRIKLLSDRLFALRALVPISSKLGRASILEDAIEHVKNLQKQEKVLRDELEYESIEERIEDRVDVVQLGGNEFFVKVFCAHKEGGFVKLIEALNSLGLEVANANVTCFGTFVSNVFIVEKRDNEMVEVDKLRESLMELTRNLSKGWHDDTASDTEIRQNGYMWYKNLGTHLLGEFSMAVVQANVLPEDQSQIESSSLSTNTSGPYGTFVGIYDGHGGPETSRYVNDHIFHHLKRLTSEHQQLISEDMIHETFRATEEGFMSLVTKQWPTNPRMAAVGTCCLIGIICNGMLYIANVGDSRAVLGTFVKETGEVLSVRLSTDHNVAIESIRQELRSLHPDDSQIVVLKNKVWRVKGIIQISRSIGDAYLKKPEFNNAPFKKPILSADPSIYAHKLQPDDRFIIFASDGLWNYISDEEAVDIVHNHPHNGSARKLVKAALKKVAKRRKISYSALKNVDIRVRRGFHDDISAVVVFLDSNLVSSTSLVMSPALSVKGGEFN